MNGSNFNHTFSNRSIFINLILEEHYKNLTPYKDLLEDRSGVEF